jgi:hypothetical protein
MHHTNVYGALKVVDSDYVSVLYVGEMSINIPSSYGKHRCDNDIINTMLHRLRQ